MDRFDYSRIRPDIVESLDAYTLTGRPLGHFLTAVLENDLFEACGRADQDNLWTLPIIVAYIYNKMPATCHGSPERVIEWRKHYGLRGVAAGAGAD